MFVLSILTCICVESTYLDVIDGLTEARLGARSEAPKAQAPRTLDRHKGYARRSEC